MYGKAVLVIATTVIILLMLFGNSKVRVFSVLVNQIKVFKNVKTEKLSWWDIVCFIIMPICLAIILTIGFRCIIDDDLASVLTTVFAFVFTVLFGFAAILVGKMESNNDIERKVVGETFVSIVSSTILSLLAAILSIIILETESEMAEKIISCVVYSFSFMIIMLLLMITKRTFLIYNDKDENEQK